MRKIVIVLLILLAAFLMSKRESIGELIERVSSKQTVEFQWLQPYKSLRWNGKQIACIKFFVSNELQESEDENHQQQTKEEESEQAREEYPSASHPSPANPNPSKVCKRVYVIDKEEQKEEGHYEIIHHPEVTRTERSYKEYIEYVFYRDDGSIWIYKDYDNSFNAEAYFNNHADEFSRYTFSRKYDEIKTIVVVSEAYDEKVWVVDIPYAPEIGHYEDICE